jgi:hypothetical protein
LTKKSPTIISIKTFTDEMVCRPTSEEESTDFYGYLKPTFHRFSTGSELGFSASTLATPPEPIPIESYANFGETASANPVSSEIEINSNNLVLTGFNNQALTGSTITGLTGSTNPGLPGSPSPALTGLTGSSTGDPTDSTYDTPRSLTSSSQEKRLDGRRPLILALESVQV